MKKFIQAQIAKKARRFVQENKPIIIAITGSVGKTSTRNAIAAVLSSKYKVAKNFRGYNNEFGVPLTILGKKSPGKSVLGWLKVLSSAPNTTPDVFVLEYGVDRPGDMKYLCDIAKPTIGVYTTVSPVHAEHFASIEALAEEKAHMLESVSKDGLCVLNADDPRVAGLSKHCSSEIVKYGFSGQADVQGEEYQLWTRNDFSFEPGEKFSEVTLMVSTQDNDSFPVKLPNMLGKASVSTVLAAIAVAKHLGLTTNEILSGLEDIPQEPGRMTPLPGIKGSLILDSSYNAAPASMAAAVEILREFDVVGDARRIAVLGTMSELGKYSEDEHRQLGMRAAEVVDVLLTVGEEARDARRGAIEAGLDENNAHHFKNSVEAGRWLDAHIGKGDIVLVKGSRSVGMEAVVRDVMAEPLRFDELCVTG